MSFEAITQAALSLPIVERIALARILWKSIDAGMADPDERYILNEVLQRDAELQDGRSTACSHGEVIKAAKAELG